MLSVPSAASAPVISSAWSPRGGGPHRRCWQRAKPVVCWSWREIRPFAAHQRPFGAAIAGHEGRSGTRPRPPAPVLDDGATLSACLVSLFSGLGGSSSRACRTLLCVISSKGRPASASAGRRRPWCQKGRQSADDRWIGRGAGSRAPASSNATVFLSPSLSPSPTQQHNPPPRLVLWIGESAAAALMPGMAGRPAMFVGSPRNRPLIRGPGILSRSQQWQQ